MAGLRSLRGLGSSNPPAPYFTDATKRCRMYSPCQRLTVRCPMHVSAASNPAFDSAPEQPPKDYQPFPRLREGNPYRLLGLGKDASFEEVQEARNYLYQEYKWHEPSRESIELAFERILKENFQNRKKTGFRPPRTGKRTDVIGEPDKVTLSKRFWALFDPTVSLTTLINEGVIFAGLAAWALFSSDQSFPLAGAFAYSVYKYQQKRIKASPEGPHFGGNPIVGAVLTTAVNIGIACALMTVVTAPLQSVLEASMRQVGAFLVIFVAGMLSVYIK